MAKKDTHLTQPGAEVQKILNGAQLVYIGLPNEVVQPDEGDICIVPAHDNVEAEAFEYRNGAWVSRGSIDQAIAKAISAYQKPDTGIPASDLAIDVQTSLEKADAAMPGITALPSPIVSSGDSLAKYVSTHLNDTGIYYFVWVGPLSDEDTATNSGLAYVFVFENESQSTVRLVLFGGTTASNLYSVTHSLSNVYSLKKFAIMEDIPTNVSDLANDVGFITKSVDDLVNYYLKSETYTKNEVNSLIDAIQGFSYVVVSELPSASAETMGVIYLLPSADPQTQNVKDEFITVDNGSSAQTRYTWEQIGSTAIDLSDYVTDSDLSAALSDYTTTANLTTLLAGKQDTISDLSTIRSGASAGATAYQKPAGGIPKTDMASGVQTSLGNADSAYQKPSGGIPKTDLSSDVQTSLGKADSALQSFTETDPTVPSWAKQSTKPTYSYEEISNTPDLADVAVSGDYDDLDNKPTIPAAQIQSDWGQTDTSAKDFIKNKPTIPSPVTVDQTYDGTSSNAQSGVAVAGALATKQDVIDSSHKLPYNLVSDTPTIPTVPDISTNIDSDAASDIKTASPKAVKTYVDNGLENAFSVGSQQDGTLVITKSNGDIITVVLNHSHDEYYSKVIGSSQPASGFVPDIVYNLGTLTGTVAFELDDEESDHVNHYFWTFETGSTVPTVTWPSGITWAGGTAPTLAENKHYEISILGGVALYLEV